MTLISPLDDLREALADAPCWGIDPSTHRMSIGVILSGGQVTDESVATGAGDGWRVVSREMARGEGPLRLAQSLRIFKLQIAETAEAYGAPVFTVLEQPFGRQVHPSSYYFVAMAQIALLDVLGEGALVHLEGPPHWKKPAMGQGAGNAGKPQILRWAREILGYEGRCPKCGDGYDVDGVPLKKCDKACVAHDEADSLGIAVAAARRWAKHGTEVV